MRGGEEWKGGEELMKAKGGERREDELNKAEGGRGVG